ncbi:hypothetical protein RHSIM_Rhsim11G0028000 [Rhododendron simsii]|uniref:Uncharacterized protein n=1 Tax=Rhododendron simsii TaxID=118357 RepID=A0A834LBK5_RHOSS|nr:hypothetical protein RHSIM_Rhsim11G0028000 [Rhododendron simsii]
MDPRYTGEMLRHLEKQNEHLMDAYRSMSHELHKLQVEEEMLMRKFFELMSAQSPARKNEEETFTLLDDGRNGQSSALIPACNNEPIGQSSASLIPVCSDEPIGQSSALTPVSGNKQEIMGDQVQRISYNL